MSALASPSTLDSAAATSASPQGLLMSRAARVDDPSVSSRAGAPERTLVGESLDGAPEFHRALVGEVVGLVLLFSLTIILLINAPKMKSVIRGSVAVLVTLVWVFDNPDKGLDFLDRILNLRPETEKGRTLALVFYFTLPLTLANGATMFFFSKIAQLFFAAFLGASFQKGVVDLSKAIFACDWCRRKIHAHFFSVTVFVQVSNMWELWREHRKSDSTENDAMRSIDIFPIASVGEVAAPAAAAIGDCSSTGIPQPASSSSGMSRSGIPAHVWIEAFLNLVLAFSLFLFAALLVMRCVRSFYHFFVATTIALFFVSSAGELCVFARYRFAPYCGSEEGMLAAWATGGEIVQGQEGGGLGGGSDRCNLRLMQWVWWGDEFAAEKQAAVAQAAREAKLLALDAEHVVYVEQTDTMAAVAEADPDETLSTSSSVSSQQLRNNNSSISSQQLRNNSSISSQQLLRNLGHFLATATTSEASFSSQESADVGTEPRPPSLDVPTEAGAKVWFVSPEGFYLTIPLPLMILRNPFRANPDFEGWRRSANSTDIVARTAAPFWRALELSWDRHQNRHRNDMIAVWLVMLLVIIVVTAFSMRRHSMQARREDAQAERDKHKAAKERIRLCFCLGEEEEEESDDDLVTLPDSDVPTDESDDEESDAIGAGLAGTGGLEATGAIGVQELGGTGIVSSCPTWGEQQQVSNDPWGVGGEDNAAQGCVGQDPTTTAGYQNQQWAAQQQEGGFWKEGTDGGRGQEWADGEGTGWTAGEGTGWTGGEGTGWTGGEAGTGWTGASSTRVGFEVAVHAGGGSAGGDEEESGGGGGSSSGQQQQGWDHYGQGHGGVQSSEEVDLWPGRDRDPPANPELQQSGSSSNGNSAAGERPAPNGDDSFRPAGVEAVVARSTSEVVRAGGGSAAEPVLARTISSQERALVPASSVKGGVLARTPSAADAAGDVTQSADGAKNSGNCCPGGQSWDHWHNAQAGGMSSFGAAGASQESARGPTRPAPEAGILPSAFPEDPAPFPLYMASQTVAYSGFVPPDNSAYWASPPDNSAQSSSPPDNSAQSSSPPNNSAHWASSSPPDNSAHYASSSPPDNSAHYASSSPPDHSAHYASPPDNSAHYASSSWSAQQHGGGGRWDRTSSFPGRGANNH